MKNKAVPIKEVIENFIKEKAPQNISIQTKLLTEWPKIISKSAALKTKPVLIKDKILVVVVSNSSWLHQLTMDKNKILKKISKIADKEVIKDIRFKIGQVD